MQKDLDGICTNETADSESGEEQTGNATSIRVAALALGFGQPMSHIVGCTTLPLLYNDTLVYLEINNASVQSATCGFDAAGA